MHNFMSQTEKLILTGGIEIAYVDEGNGRDTLIFIHGLGSNLGAWKKNIAHLQHKFRCIALDLPGYGESTTGNLPYSMRYYVRILKNFIDEFELPRVTLVGHSMGGQLALMLAASGYEKIKKIILAAPAGLESFHSFEKELMKSSSRPFFLKSQKAENIGINYDLSFYKMPKDAQYMLQDRLNLMKNPQKYEDYCHLISRCIASMLDETVFEKLDLIQQPTLIVFGANDFLIPNRLFHPTDTPLSIGTRGQRKIPKSELVILSQCGHFVPFEAADRFNELITEFVNS